MSVRGSSIECENASLLRYGHESDASVSSTRHAVYLREAIGTMLDECHVTMSTVHCNRLNSKSTCQLPASFCLVIVIRTTMIAATLCISGFPANPPPFITPSGGTFAPSTRLYKNQSTPTPSSSTSTTTKTNQSKCPPPSKPTSWSSRSPLRCTHPQFKLTCQA